MTYLFPATWYGEETIQLGVFFDRQAAEQFAREINDECQAEVVEVDEVALVDRYGFPIKASEIIDAGIQL
jgi:hypothetical protein